MGRTRKVVLGLTLGLFLGLITAGSASAAPQILICGTNSNCGPGNNITIDDPPAGVVTGIVAPVADGVYSPVCEATQAALGDVVSGALPPSYLCSKDFTGEPGSTCQLTHATSVLGLVNLATANRQCPGSTGTGVAVNLNGADGILIELKDFHP
jgi:hypothetical protein